MTRHILVVFVLACTVSVFMAQNSDWKFRKQEDGIKAYTRDVDDSAFDEYRLTMIVDASADEVLSVIRDHTVFEDIYNNVTDVKNITDDVDLFINYARVNTPFPAKDREAVYVNRISRLGSRILVDVTCTTDHYESNPKMVQITDCQGRWTLSNRADGGAIVQQVMQMNPGGSVPGWIANRYVVNEPLYTFKKIKARAEAISKNKSK